MICSQAVAMVAKAEAVVRCQVYPWKRIHVGKSRLQALRIRLVAISRVKMMIALITKAKLAATDFIQIRN